MLADEIRMNIKKSIASIANLDQNLIDDNASYKKDLHLDSLTVLEIAVDAEMQFQIKIPDEELSKLETIDETVQLIQRHLVGAVAA